MCHIVHNAILGTLNFLENLHLPVPRWLPEFVTFCCVFSDMAVVVLHAKLCFHRGWMMSFLFQQCPDQGNLAAPSDLHSPDLPITGVGMLVPGVLSTIVEPLLGRAAVWCFQWT